MSTKTRIFLGQLYEHEGKYGTYLTGPFAAGGRLYIERSKESGKWNMYLAENEKREAANGTREPAQSRAPQGPIGSDDTIPF